MNDKMTSLDYGASDHSDATGNTQITDFTQVVSCAVGRNRHEQRREKIREELVREYFGHESTAPSAAPSLRHRLLKLLKFN
jgi:hypothetical protein